VIVKDFQEFVKKILGPIAEKRLLHSRLVRRSSSSYGSFVRRQKAFASQRKRLFTMKCLMLNFVKREFDVGLALPAHLFQ
jgi:hypothetical protein